MLDRAPKAAKTYLNGGPPAPRAVSFPKVPEADFSPATRDFLFAGGSGAIPVPFLRGAPSIWLVAGALWRSGGSLG